MHLADRLQLPAGYAARPYRGSDDHAIIAQILAAYRRSHGVLDSPTAEQIDVAYAHMTGCDPALDIYIVTDAGGESVAYGRAVYTDLEHGGRDCVVFIPVVPEHRSQPLFEAAVTAHELHLVEAANAVGASRYLAYAHHPGPDEPATGEAAWLESLGYEATEWGATLVRPNLDDIADLALPDGVEVRPVAPEQMREIVIAHHECFRGEWDFEELTDSVFAWLIDDPRRDETLWQVAWHGDTIVGQVKPFIDHEANAAQGRLVGFAEYISTHHEWRNQGIAGALLSRSLRALRDRGMTEATLGVDTNNPGGAFQLYTKLGFELRSYQAVYTKVIKAG